MMYETLNDYLDQEKPGLTAEKFDKKVKKQFNETKNPVIKPKDIFEGFKEDKKKNKKKNISKAKK